MKTKGFTLLETIIYIALFSMMLTGTLSSVYAIGVSGRNSAEKSAVQDEGLWLLESLAVGARNMPTTSFFLSSSTLMQIRRGATETVSGNDYAIQDFLWVEKEATKDIPHSITYSFRISSRSFSPMLPTATYSKTIYLIP